jgi:hypothetical protein
MAHVIMVVDPRSEATTQLVDERLGDLFESPARRFGRKRNV